jgi:succinoglycan biosynthesis transport protein ExoP
MNLIQLLKLFSSKAIYIIAIPVVVAALVFFATANLDPQYNASSTLFTGVTSNTGLTVENVRVDNVATQNEYNNIMTMLKSTQFYEEVALSLFTQHLLQEKAQKEIFSEEAFEELKVNVPDEVRKLVVKNNFDVTYENIKKYIVQDEANYVYRLLNYGHKYYSVQAVANLKAERLSNSDLIKLSFQSTDPGIAYNTVKFATAIFIRNYSGLKISMSNSAVAYFEKKLQEVQDRLDASEQKLLEYNIENDIINYYEQTEQVTTQQEKIEILLQEVKMQFEASISVLEKIEKEVETRYNINLRNTEIMRIRQQLVNISTAVTSIELNEASSFKAQLPDLKRQQDVLEKQLRLKIDSLNIFENKSQGIETQRILSQWLDAVKNNQTYAAQYASMKDRQIEFMKQFKRFAPIGANIKRFEREIDVFEREYLSILHHLSLARQNEQNVNMRSTMKVSDDAKFPINAIMPPRKLYMIAAALFALIFYLMAVLIIELLDKRIKKPSILNKYSGLTVLAGYSTPSNKKYPDNEKINQQADLFVFEKLKQLSKQNKKPIVVQLCSTWDDAGKAAVANRIDEKLKLLGYESAIVNFNAEQESEGSQTSNNATEIPLVKLNSYDEYVAQLAVVPDFLISIFPALSDGISNPVLLENADIVLLIYSANTSWADADLFILEKVKAHVAANVNSASIYGVLTNTFPDYLEEIYGEIPKKRSPLRKLMKKLLSRMV